jgi:hypothetical protein
MYRHTAFNRLVRHSSFGNVTDCHLQREDSIAKECVGISLFLTIARTDLEATDPPAEWLPEGGLHQMSRQGINEVCSFDHDTNMPCIIVHRLTYNSTFTSYTFKEFTYMFYVHSILGIASHGHEATSIVYTRQASQRQKH